MPVRARSRASRSSRKASQFSADGAQLVELGVEAGGDDAAVAQQHRRLLGDARASRSAIVGRRLQRLRAASSSRIAACRPAAAARSAGSAGSVARSPASSRGRTWRSAMRAVMRSTSLTLRSASRSGSKPRVEQRARSRRGAGSRRGARAAAGSANGAARGCPCRCGRCRAATAASARPRRAGSASVPGCGAWSAAGRSARSARSTCRRCTWAQRLALRVLGVGSAARRRRRAPLAGPRAEAGQRRHAAAARSSLRWPSAASNCHAGRRGDAPRALWLCSAGRAASAVDAAPRPARAAPASRPARRSLHSRQAELRRCDSASQARPQRARDARCTASSSASLASASSSLSVSVPGVTTRTTLRSTGPLAVATSPTCSQIATDFAELDQPRQIAFDRMHRHAGHHDRLAGAAPRAVSVMSSSRCAPFARRRRTARRSRPCGRTRACPGCSALMRRYCCIIGVWPDRLRRRSSAGSRARIG